MLFFAKLIKNGGRGGGGIEGRDIFQEQRLYVLLGHFSKTLKTHFTRKINILTIFFIQIKMESKFA